MSEKEILKKLNLLGVNSPTQIKGSDLSYYWQKKYKEIKESKLKKETIKEKLMEINEIYEELNTFDKEELKKILISASFENQYADSDPDIVSFLKYADISFENGNYNSAARNYGYAIRYYLQYQEERSEIYYKRGLSKWNSGTFYSKEEILYDLEKALELENKNSKYLLTLVDYKFSIGCSKEEYRKLLNFDGIREIFHQRGLENESCGELENAAFFYSLAENFKGLNPKSLLNKGIMHKDRDISYQTVQRTDDFYEAEKYFNLAIEKNNQFPDPYFHRSELYLEKFKLYWFPDFNESKNFLTKSIQDLKSALKIRYDHKWNDLLNEAKNISRNYYRLSKQGKNLWGKKIDKRGWENEFEQWFENL